MDNKWECISYIIASKNRYRVLLHLIAEPNTPSSLSKLLRIPISNVSRALRELFRKDLIVCLTPNAKRGRIYYATEKGRSVIEKIRNQMSLYLEKRENDS